MNKPKFLKDCKRHGNVEHRYVKRKGFPDREQCCICNREAVKRRRDKIKLMALEYKGGKCEICGYSKCVQALEFHHLDPNEKEFGIGQDGETRSWERTKRELDKCILVCSNCHREIHSEEGKVAPY